MKIANSYDNCKCPCRNHTPKHENCKLMWKLQTDMKIANWYENCKAILMFWCIVPTWTFAVFIWDTAGMKTCSETERMFPYRWFRYALLVPTVARVHFFEPKPLVCILISMGSTWDIGTKYRYVINLQDRRISAGWKYFWYFLSHTGWNHVERHRQEDRQRHRQTTGGGHCCAQTEQPKLTHVQKGISEFAWFHSNHVGGADTTINQ